MKKFKLNLLLTALSVLLFLNGSSFAELLGNANNLSNLGAGARPLGMGRAYVAVAEDADAIFLNPAGLGRSNSMKLTSMYSNLMGDVSYMVLGGSYPLEVGSVGVGLLSGRVDGIPIFGSDALSSTHYPTITSFGNYSNNIIFVAYGFPLEKVIGDYGKNIYLGSSLKYFDITSSGTADANKGSGRGMDVDAAILYVPLKWLTLGLNEQNILPKSLGGEITYNSGVEERIPSVTKLGFKANILGKSEDSFIESPYRFNISADGDISKVRPGVIHLGAEFSPADIIALRAGLDQDPVPSQLDPSEGRNITYGVGLKLKGMQFDYAYHPYSGIPENATHYFSVSYVGGNPEASKDNKYLTVIKPKDKLITRRDYVSVIGILSGDVDKVNINGTDATINFINGEKTFNIKISLETVGKKLIVVTAYDKHGRVLETRKRRVLRISRFSDVDQDYWARESIEFAATAGLINGYPDGNFQPNKALTRAELAALIMKLKGQNLSEGMGNQMFPDVPSSFWATKFINAASSQKVVLGYPDKKFRPNKEINRVEGVSVAVRFEGGEIIVPDKDPYSDVSKNHWASGLIETAKADGFLDYLNSDQFEPLKGLTRAEAITIFAKTSIGKARIDELFNWNKGFSTKAILRAEEE